MHANYLNPASHSLSSACPVQLNRDKYSNKNREAITFIAIGIFLLLGAFFLFLSALLPIPNVINWGVANKVAAGVAMGAGLLCIYASSRHSKEAAKVTLPSEPIQHIHREKEPPKNPEIIKEAPPPSFQCENIDGMTKIYQPLEITEFESDNLLPSSFLPNEMLALICSFLDAKTTTTLAGVSKDWYFFVNHLAEEAIDHLLSKPYRAYFPYEKQPAKRYSNLNCLRLTLEHDLYKQHALNDLYSLYHIEIISQIRSWGTVRAIMADDIGFSWCFVVDFLHPIFISERNERGVMVNMTGGHGIFDSPFYLRGMYERGSTRVSILSRNRIAFSIDVIKNIFLWSHASVIDDPCIKSLNGQIKAQERLKNHEAASELRKEYLQFTQDDCLRFTLQMVRNSGLKILNMGLHLNGNDPYKEFSLQEIIENYTSNRWQITYLNNSP